MAPMTTPVMVTPESLAFLAANESFRNTASTGNLMLGCSPTEVPIQLHHPQGGEVFERERDTPRPVVREDAAEI
jgi:hypothetical protein